MLDTNKLPMRILHSLEQRGHAPEEITAMSVEEAFTEYCTWEGLVHWGPILLEALRSLNNPATGDQNE